LNAVGRTGTDRDAVARYSPNGRDPGAVVDDADRLGDGHRAVSGRVEHVDLAASVCHGEREGKSLGKARVHAPLSVPVPETKVRLGPACAGAAERPQARRAAAMACIDVIFVMECLLFCRCAATRDGVAGTRQWVGIVVRMPKLSTELPLMSLSP